MIHAVIFDMDGLLLDTERILVDCWQQAAAQMGFPLTREHALHIRSLAGEYAGPYLQSQLGPDFDYAAIRARRKELMEERLKQEGLVPKPGGKELLTWLRQNGYKTAVATATDPERAKRYLEQVGLLPLLDRVICATMVPHGKPMPDVYQFACQELGEDPAHCLALEDSPNGVLSAWRAGCRVIMVPDLTLPDPETASLLWATADNLTKVPALLQKKEEKL